MSPSDSPLAALPRRRGGIATWLSQVPVDDPVDRRNAPMLQVVLLLLGIPTPLIWLYRAVLVDQPWRPGELQSMAMAMATSALALFSLWLVRHGRFQWALRQILALVAAATLFAYATQGAKPHVFEEPVLVVWIVLAGLMIGRGALWLMFATIATAFVAAGAHAVVHAADAQWPVTELVILATKLVIFLLIAVVVDRSVAALRETLAESSRRAEALAQANARLEAEMAERRRTEDKLIHAQKVEATGRLAAGVAHDFNHLLALIVGYVGKGRQADTLDGALDALEGVDGAARRAIATTSRMLDFSRYDSARVERFDAVAALRGIEPLLRQTLGPAVRLEMVLPEDEAAVLFDRAQLDLVVLNIAANAADAMPAGGSFQLRLRAGADSGIEVLLSDSGHGMNAEVLARVFEPFFTTRPAGEGTGLGLSVVDSVMKAHGARVEATSVEGTGSQFRLLLPRAD